MSCEEFSICERQLLNIMCKSKSMKGLVGKAVAEECRCGRLRRLSQRQLVP